MNELVSIVVPIYNMGDSIEKCVKSLLKQDYKNVEIILVDDGSKDNSYEVCLKLEKEDNRIKVYHTENRGSGPARNYGIEHANGRYICFPDADDVYSVDAVFKMLSAMKNGEYDFVVAGYQLIDTKDVLVKEKTYPDTVVPGDELRKNYDQHIGIDAPCSINGAPWNKLYDMEIIRRNNIRFPALRRHQDTSFISRYLCHVKKVHFIVDVVYIHYLNDLKKEWYKYPVDYIDAVIGLYEVYKETILTWNPDNINTSDKVKKLYISNVIKAMELTYSPKVKYSRRERRERIKEMMQKSGLLEFSSPAILGRYQEIICSNLRKGRINTAMLLMYIKVLIEKNGILTWIKVF